MANIDLATAITNLSNSFDDIKKLIIAISYVSGLYMIIRGLALYKALGQSMSGHGAQKGEIAGPLVWMVVGVMLMYLPDTIKVSNQTIFGTSEINRTMNLTGTGIQLQIQKIIQLLYKYFDLIGFISFVRGWFILSKMGHAGSQPGSIGKGITHLVGGILLMNIIDFYTIMANTLGFS